MRNRFWMFKRGAVFYCEDSQTGEQKSLRTKDPKEARKLVDAKNDALNQSTLNLAIGKAYLAARDTELPKRTWRLVMQEFCSIGKESTRERRRRAIRGREFDHIRDKQLVETTADDLRKVMRAGGAFTNHFMRYMHNLAKGFGWLPWDIIPTRKWPLVKSKEKRAITAEEHARIVESEKNVEHRLYYEMLWETGAAQSDGALLRAEMFDLQKGVLSYSRQKTGEMAFLAIGSKLRALLEQLPSTGLLFPSVARSNASRRAAEFRRRCRVVGIDGISLHSYRYAWAQRAYKSGYPERWAKAALGHNSAAVHQTYAKGAEVICPALETYELNNRRAFH